MLKRTFIGLIRSHEQTGETPAVPELKTRYYKLSSDSLWDEAVRIIASKPGYKLLHQIKNSSELVLEKRTMTGRVQDVTLSIFSINPMTSAIDIYSASRGSLGDLGSNYRTIMELYSALDTQLKEYKL